MTKLRKIFAAGVIFMTVLSLSVVAVPNASAGVAQAGDLIKTDGMSSVYYLADDGKRYSFPNETTYFSWFSDFSGVVVVSQSELEGYRLGGNIVMRAGTKLVKITTDPKVYAVETGGSLRWVSSETDAKCLYGDDWASRVVDVPDQLIGDYMINGKSYGNATDADVEATKVQCGEYPEGSLIKTPDGSDVYYIDADGNARKIASESAFLGNMFNWDDIITTSDTYTLPTMGSNIANAEGDLIDVAQGGTDVVIVVPGANVTVALAADTPEAGNIPQGSPNDFLKFNITASNEGTAKINSIKLTAYDLGDATKIDNVTFYDNGAKVGTSKNFTSDREAIFNFSTPIEIAAGMTKALTVRATITASSGNYTLGIEAAADLTIDGGNVIGSFPIVGNSKSIVSGVPVGTVTQQNADTTDATHDFGEDDVLLAAFDLAVQNEDVLWESATFRNGGTNKDGIVDNLRVFIDGDEVADGMIVDKDFVFQLDNYKIIKGDTINVEIYGDLGISNAGDTLNLYVRNASDFSFVGQSYGYGIEMTRDTNLEAAGDGKTITLATGDFSIDMDKTATPSQDAKSGQNDYVLATITMTSNGENATVNSISDTGANDFTISGTGLEAGEIENLELKDTNTGVVYDIAEAFGASLNSGNPGWTLSITEEISMIQGETKTFELRCDLVGPNSSNANAPIDDGDTLKVTLGGAAMNITGDESDANITNVTPSNVAGGVITIKDATLDWTARALTDKTVVPGAQEVALYSAALEVGESSDVKLTSVKLTDTTASGAFDDNNVSQLDLYLIDGEGEKLLKSTSGSIDETNDTINFNSLNATNRVIAAGDDVYLEVRARFTSSFATIGAITLAVNHATDAVEARDADNNVVAENLKPAAGVVSRTVTLKGAGTLKVELKTDDAKADTNSYLLAGSETEADKYIGELVFTTANEEVKVKTLVLEQQGSADGADMRSVVFYDVDGNMIAEKAVDASGHLNFSDFNLVLPADQATSLFLAVKAKGINVEGEADSTADHGDTAIFSFAGTSTLSTLGLAANEAVTAIGVDSSEDIPMTEDTDNSGVVTNQYTDSDVNSNTATITGSILKSVVNDMGTVAVGSDTATGPLTGGTTIIGKYKFTFDNGSNRATTTNEALLAQMKTLVLNISVGGAASSSNIYAYIEGQSGNPTATVQPTPTGVATIDLSSMPGDTEAVDGSVVLVIKADVSTDNENDSLQTKINDLSTDFTYNGMGGAVGTTDFSNALLEYPDVIGAYLSN